MTLRTVGPRTVRTLSAVDPSAERRHSVRVSEICFGQEVSVVGRLDVHTVAEVRLALHAALERGTGDLLVHLVEAEVHDATGLGVIVGVHHRARRLGRRLVLVDVSPRLDRLLLASRLHRVLTRGLDEGAAAGVPVTVVPPAVVPLTVVPPTVVPLAVVPLAVVPLTA